MNLGGDDVVLNDSVLMGEIKAIEPIRDDGPLEMVR